MTKQEKRDSDAESLSRIEMMRIVSLNEAARLAGVHRHTLQTHHGDKIIRISKGRLGMRVRDALMIKDKA